MIGEFRRRVMAWNGGRASWRDLEFLFSLDSGYPQVSTLEETDAILSLGQRKWVPARLVQLEEPTESAQADFDRLLFRHTYYDSDHNQGADKILALNWLASRGALKLAAEGDYIAGRYDVASQDLGVVVECGTTRLDKLLRTALSAEWREFVLVPRGLKIAIVFTLTKSPFERIRRFAERALDRRRFLELACREPRTTRSSLERCVIEADEEYSRQCRKIADLLNHG